MPVPIDREAVARRAMEAAGGEARSLAARAERAAEGALGSSTAAHLALADVRRAAEQLRQAIGEGHAALNARGAELLAAAGESVAAAQGALARVEDARAAAVEARLLAGRERQQAATAAVEARSSAEAALRSLGKLVGLEFFEFQGDELVVVLTDGRMFRRNLRGPRGYGSSGPPGRDGSDGEDGRSVLRTVVATDSDYVFVGAGAGVLVNAGAGERSVVLPRAADHKDEFVGAKRVNQAGGNVVVTSAGGAMEGLSTIVLDSYLDAITLVSDGADWWAFF